MRFYWLLAALFLAAGCDSAFEGDVFDNQPPDTELSVKDTSLVDNIDDRDRLASTVAVSWSGTDPDGFVIRYEIRFSETGTFASPEAGWSSTTATDTLILLPIPRGAQFGNVAFEVRAIDNAGLADPTPARTVFPVKNSPPTLALNGFEAPPDTTFTIISFSWEANDPEGLSNLARIEIALNDSTQFVALPPDVNFITLKAPAGAAGPVIDAELFTGRALRRFAQDVPGLRLDADNILYLRAFDQTDTSSALIRYPDQEEAGTWYVRAPRGRVLYVNDYRKNTWPVIQDFHLALLRDYLPAGENVDVWNVSEPFASGSSGAITRSDAMPPSAEPMLSETLALYDYIYWVATNSTNNTVSNNLPFAASASATFFEQGGRMMVHSPISLPSDPTDLVGNPAILLLPLTELVSFPDSLRQSLRLNAGTALTPDALLPVLESALPPLKTTGFILGTLPYGAISDNARPVLSAEYTYVTRLGSRQGVWPGISTVASVSADGRVGLFAIPLLNETSGEPLLVGADDDPEAARTAVKLLLESLGFPKR